MKPILAFLGGKKMAKAATAEKSENEAETPSPEAAAAAIAEAVLGPIADMLSAHKRPFFVSEEAAEKLTMAFDALIEELIDDDGEIDEENEYMETLEKFVEIMATLKG